ncbi:MAG TPA: hypothetical protein VFV44_08850, partial [Nitrospiraceae bacterium]|nr:hypothetical protein [Nitrospiraceae bacterium]
ACLVGMLTIRPAFCRRQEGDNIMTCGVARLSQNLLRVELVFCCECGSGDLEVFYTSKALGPHLCPTCIQSKVECGVAEGMLRSPMTEQPVA